MATRRIISQEKTLLEKDDSIGSNPAANEKSNITPAVPISVIIKLLAFTLGMIVIPIGSYFVTVDTVFNGARFTLSSPTPSAKSSTGPVTPCPMQPCNSTYAGALAAIMANAVLIGYIFVAMAEDQSWQQQQGGAGTSKEGKKDR